jgi:hypothetical protein
MQFRQQRIRGAVSVHFMTVPGTKGQLAGLQLLGAFFKGPQDFSLTDGANQLGRKVWEGLGGVTVPGYSFHWKRVLRPTALALERVARKVPLGSAVQSVLRPFSGLGDRYLARVMPYRYSIAPVPLDTANLTLEALHDNVRECSADDSLRPDYDIAGLGWLLDRAARIRQSGDLQTACVLERGDRLGWYMYYLRPGGESRVLQVGARRHAFHQVFDHMCRHAWERGAIALTGRIEPKYVAVLAERQCSFSGGDPWLQIQSRDKDLLQTILSGDAFLTDLEGEWCTSFRGT